MATENSTKPSSASCETRDAPRPSLELNLPVGETRRSLPPLLSLAEMMRRNRQLRQWFSGGIRRPEERWRAKTAEPFQL
jgi:hypothetical protein